jgi:hypothetical protein
MRVDAAVRLFRSVLVTACVVSLAAGAHVAGGGVLPDLALVAALTVLTLVPVTLVSGRRLSLPVFGGVLAGGQLLLHGAFEMFSGSASCAPAIGSTTGSAIASGHAGAGMNHAVNLSQCLPAGTGQMVPHMIDAGVTPGMVMTHLLATAVTALMLARGEDAFWQLLAWLRPLIRLPETTPVTGWPEVPGYQDNVPAPPAWRNLSADPQRGPPALRYLEAAPR